MKKTSLFSPLILGIFALGGFLGYINMPEDDVQQKRQQSFTPVKVAMVKEEAFPVVIEALGTAVANESVNITAQRTEVIKTLAFEDGDSVETGQLLVQLENTEESARVNELLVNLTEARRQYVRIKDLNKEKVASEQMLDEQQARVKSLEAQLDVARTQLGELEIRAPFSGQLGVRQVSPGSLVQPGDMITTLDDIERVKVDFSVSENHLASLSKGQKVEAVSVAYPDDTFIGEIANVGSRIDPTTRSIQVRAVISNQDAQLRPGMLLQIRLQKRVLQALVLPEKALVPNQDKQFVYVLDGDKVVETEVQIGERRPGSVEIISGLKAGQEVVVEGTLRVRDQSPVNVLNRGGV